MSVDELDVMEGGKCLLQIKRHPANYKYLSDYALGNAFDIDRFLLNQAARQPWCECLCAIK